MNEEQEAVKNFQENAVKRITILMPIAHHMHPTTSRCLDFFCQLVELDIVIIRVSGFSEVARARNRVASSALETVEARGGVVLWLDADMVILNLATLLLHIQLVESTGKAISGRYVQRNNPTKVAACLDPNETRKQFFHPLSEDDSIEATMNPVQSGMGCLMMPAELFVRQTRAAPSNVTKSGTHEGKDLYFREYLVCCPRFIEKEGQHFMLSEDFDYCSKIEGGAWLAHVRNGSSWSFLDYGHIAEKVLEHAPDHTSFRYDR